MDLNTKIRNLKDNRIVLVNYLKMEVRIEDWHGVQDASSDLREVDSEIEALEAVKRGDIILTLPDTKMNINTLQT